MGTKQSENKIFVEILVFFCFSKRNLWKVQPHGEIIENILRVERGRKSQSGKSSENFIVFTFQ